MFLCQVTVSLVNIVPIQLVPFILAYDIKLSTEGLVFLHDVIGVKEPHISLPLAQALQSAFEAVVRFLIRQSLAEVIVII